MLIPYHSDVVMPRVPWANWVLMGVISAWSIFAFDILDPDPLDDLFDKILFNLTGERPGPTLHERAVESMVLTKSYHPAGLFGHLFLHVGWLHLIGNMVFLFVFGNAVCAKVGNGVYIPLFLALGGVAGAASVLCEWVPAVGASGAIMAIAGLYFCWYPVNDVSLAYWFSYYFTGTITISGGWVLGCYAVWDLLMIFLHPDGMSGALAHFVGFVSGVLLALFLLRSGRIEMEETELSIIDLFGGEEVREQKTKAFIDERAQTARDAEAAAAARRPARERERRERRRREPAFIDDYSKPLGR